MLHGACVPSPLHTRELVWESVLGLGLAQLISRAKIFSYTPAQPHSFEYTRPTNFAQRVLRAQHPPHTHTTDGRYDAHGYLPRQGLQSKNQAIWRGAWILWRIMTRIRHKNQGLGWEMKTRSTHIAYNPVARFYIWKM